MLIKLLLYLFYIIYIPNFITRDCFNQMLEYFYEYCYLECKCS